MKPRTSGSWNCPVQIGVGTLTGPSYSTCAGACALAPPTLAPPTADPAAGGRSRGTRRADVLGCAGCTLLTSGQGYLLCFFSESESTS